LNNNNSYVCFFENFLQLSRFGSSQGRTCQYDMIRYNRILLCICREKTEKNQNQAERRTTRTPETGAINRIHFSCTGFWYVSCKSGTGFVWYQIPAPIRTLFHTKPESGVHVTETMTYDWSMIIAYVFMCFLVI